MCRMKKKNRVKHRMDAVGEICCGRDLLWERFVVGDLLCERFRLFLCFQLWVEVSLCWGTGVQWGEEE